MADSNRSELPVESHALLRRATWGGLVFALACVLTCLNCMPPIDVHYKVRSEIVVSETRLQQLRQLARDDRAAIKQGDHKPVQLLSVKVLDLAEQQASVVVEPTAEKVVLVEVGTLWATRCTSERHYNWLKNMSQIDPGKLANRKSAQAARFARWELSAAEHYRSQHQFMLEKERLSEPEIPTDVAVTEDRPTFQLASHTAPVNSPAPSSGTTDTFAVDEPNFGLHLSGELDRTKKQLVQAEHAWQRELEQSSGALQIAGAPAIVPRSTSMPMWLAASVLILGLAAGASAGWMEMRLHAGGVFRPSHVAEQLALESLPIAGRQRLPSVAPASATSRDISSLTVRLGRRLTRLSEWGLMFWVVIALGRFSIDTLWRDVLVESPLAALGRLLAGMP